MSGSDTGSDSRARLLAERGREAATFAWVCVFVLIPAWLWCWLSYQSLADDERVGSGTVLAAALGVV